MVCQPACRSLCLAQLVEYALVEERLGRVRAEGEGLAVEGNADPVLAVAHAELPGQLDLILQVVLDNEALQRLHDLPGTLQVAAAADTDGDFHWRSLLIRNRPRWPSAAGIRARRACP